jgi:hypothetical protein
MPSFLAIVLHLPVLAAAAGQPALVDYGREIKPILAARCTSCHGAIRQRAGLRLDTAEFVRKGGESGPAIEPGNSDASLLIDRVTETDVAERMPPGERGRGAFRRRDRALSIVDRSRCAGAG